MDGFDIIIIFLIILLIIVVIYYYRGLFYGMCASGGRNCRTCCDRKTDDYNRVKSTPVTTDELSEEELSDEETIVQSPEISNFKKLSLSLHF